MFFSDMYKRFSFNTAMDKVRCSSPPTMIEQIATLDYISDIIKIDIQGSSYAKLLYQKQGYEYGMLLPQFVKDENGNEVQSYTNERIDMTLSKNTSCLVSKIWNQKSLFSSICNVIRYGFVYNNINHYTDYYPFWNMHIVVSGNHHITCGYLKSEAAVKSFVHDITRLFDHIYTDGAYWFNAHTKEKLFDVFDFRIAVLFELGKMRSELCSQSVEPIAAAQFTNEYKHCNAVDDLYYTYQELQLYKKEARLLLEENERLRQKVAQLKQAGFHSD